MEISTTMDLNHLAERMGDTCGADPRKTAEHMRNLLVERGYIDTDTRDVPESAWFDLVVIACNRAERDDAVHFAAHDGECIYGLGDSAADALDAANEAGEGLEGLRVDRCSAALAAMVETQGGDKVRWNVDSGIMVPA